MLVLPIHPPRSFITLERIRHPPLQTRYESLILFIITNFNGIFVSGIVLIECLHIVRIISLDFTSSFRCTSLK